jgi:ubiquinol-cytochrome c reductase cytochrome c subunit
MNKRSAVLTLTLVLAAANASAQPSASDVERGRQLYMDNGCFSCHGTVGQGSDRSGAPKLAPDPYPYEAFRALVRTPREQMPRLDVKHVSDEQLQLMHRFLASLPKGLAAKNIPVLQGLQERAR